MVTGTARAAVLVGVVELNAYWQVHPRVQHQSEKETKATHEQNK